MHIERQRRCGDPGEINSRMHPRLPCLVKDCDKFTSHGRLYCQPHHTKWKTWGDPVQRPKCQVEKCDRLIMGKKVYCNSHYVIWKKGDNPNRSLRRMGTVGCSKTGCLKKHFCRGWCQTHYWRYKYRYNIQYRLACILRSRIQKIPYKKNGSAVRDLGCSLDELVNYLEKLFEDNMSWDNYGKWHIDHIKPLSLFDLTDREQFLEAAHYTNLQPLWAKDNFTKAGKSAAD